MNTKETLEEAAKNYAENEIKDRGSNNDKLICSIDFIAGARWQQERENNYSELIDLLERLTPIYKEDSDLYEKYNKQRLDIIAKGQQERSYSEVELEVAFFEGRENNLPFTEWFEQFKKK